MSIINTQSNFNRKLEEIEGKCEDVKLLESEKTFCENATFKILENYDEKHHGNRKKDKNGNLYCEFKTNHPISKISLATIFLNKNGLTKNNIDNEDCLFAITEQNDEGEEKTLNIHFKAGHYSYSELIETLIKNLNEESEENGFGNKYKINMYDEDDNNTVSKLDMKYIKLIASRFKFLLPEEGYDDWDVDNGITSIYNWIPDVLHLESPTNKFSFVNVGYKWDKEKFPFPEIEEYPIKYIKIEVRYENKNHDMTFPVFYVPWKEIEKNEYFIFQNKQNYQIDPKTNTFQIYFYDDHDIPISPHNGEATMDFICEY